MPAVQFFAKMENNNRQDDGSLAFLQIEPDANNKHFNCSEITQQKLINLSFGVIDFLDDVKTKFGTGRFLVKIKFNKEDPDKDARKFFTNCAGKFLIFYQQAYYYNTQRGIFV